LACAEAVIALNSDLSVFWYVLGAYFDSGFFMSPLSLAMGMHDLLLDSIHSWFCAVTVQLKKKFDMDQCHDCDPNPAYCA
jgi:hypothetical protein